jgi:hypothetical protein
MAEANKTYAVIGNNGLQTATLVPDLTQAIDSTFLKIEQNVEKLNCWQPIFTSDLIADNFRQEEFPISTSGNFAQGTDFVVSYDFYLKGWTQLKQIILQYALALNSNSNVGSFAGSYYGMAVPSSQDQAEYTWLDVIENLDIRIGNNNFTLTNQELHNLYGIKHLALCSAKTIGEAQAMSSFGLNAARTSGLSFTDKNWSDWQMPYLNIPGKYTNSDCWNFKSTDENARYYDHLYTNLSKFDIVSGLSPASYSTKIFALPISMVNSFFNQQDTWLPKGLRIQIQVTFNNNKTYYTGNGETRISRPTTLPTTAEVKSAGFLINPIASGTTNGIFPTSLKVVYEYSQLRYEIQESLNKLWLQRPFVYNYYEWDVYKTDLPLGSSAPYTIDFKQNSQRPLDIWICVRNTKRENFMYGAITNTANIDTTNNVTRFQVKKFGLCPVVYQYIKVFINGREIINNDITQITSALSSPPGDGLTSDDVINALIYESCDLETNNIQAPRQLSKTINFDNIFPYQITLSPSNFFQRGTYPVDQGAVNVRIELNCTFVAQTGGLLSPTWPYAGATLFVYSRRAAQLTLDASHVCTQVSWPLVVSNNTAVATPSINTN